VLLGSCARPGAAAPWEDVLLSLLRVRDRLHYTAVGGRSGSPRVVACALLALYARFAIDAQALWPG
jgi:hypothetical protein